MHGSLKTQGDSKKFSFKSVIVTILHYGISFICWAFKSKGLRVLKSYYEQCANVKNKANQNVLKSKNATEIECDFFKLVV